MVQIQRKKVLTDYKYIFPMYMDRYQCLELVYNDRLSSFFTKLSKNNMGVLDAPILLF